jgi:hypothetical protein
LEQRLKRTSTAFSHCDGRRDLPIVRVENAWPAIISKGTFDQVQILLENEPQSSCIPDG